MSDRPFIGEATAYDHGKRIHLETNPANGPTDRLILHNAIPCQVNVMRQAFGVREIGRDTYQDREASAMGATSEDEGPAQGK